MQTILLENRERLAELCRAHHVKRLAVFGSAVREDFDQERSDFDFLVEFESETPRYARNFFAFEEALAAFYSRRVDLLTFGSVRNPFILRAIDADQQTLYAA